MNDFTKKFKEFCSKIGGRISKVEEGLACIFPEELHLRIVLEKGKGKNVIKIDTAVWEDGKMEVIRLNHTTKNTISVWLPSSYTNPTIEKAHGMVSTGVKTLAEFDIDLWNVGGIIVSKDELGYITIRPVKYVLEKQR